MRSSSPHCPAAGTVCCETETGLDLVWNPTQSTSRQLRWSMRSSFNLSWPIWPHMSTPLGALYGTMFIFTQTVNCSVTMDGMGYTVDTGVATVQKFAQRPTAFLPRPSAHWVSRVIPKSKLPHSHVCTDEFTQTGATYYITIFRFSEGSYAGQEVYYYPCACVKEDDCCMAARAARKWFCQKEIFFSRPLLNRNSSSGCRMDPLTKRFQRHSQKCNRPP